MKIELQRTMRAEMKPDCYGGKTCDQIVPRWNCYADGDKQDDYISEALALDPKHFPPGTTVIVSEPVCPSCSEPRFPKMPQPKRGPFFDPKCRCGFDWDEWTLEQYS